MIRSIFDFEGLPDEEKPTDKSGTIQESSAAEGAPVEIQGTEVSPEISASKIVETVPEREVEAVGEAKNIGIEEPRTSFEIEQILPPQLENAVKSRDAFLGFENELTKIEEELQHENEPNLSHQTSPAEIEVLEPVRNEPIQTGIFTAALEKEQRERNAPASLEDLLVFDSEPLVTPDVPEVENTGFILPNRAEIAIETQGFILPKQPEASTDDPPNIIDFRPESKAEIIRKSGLAWSAGIAFFASVVFLLIIGWFADLLLGTAPWGAVGGIIVGSIIGFVQLFRLTSQILKNNE